MSSYNTTTIPETYDLLSEEGYDFSFPKEGASTDWKSTDEEVSRYLDDLRLHKLYNLSKFVDRNKADRKRLSSFIETISGHPVVPLRVCKWLPDVLILDGGHTSLIAYAICQSIGHALTPGPDILVILPKDEKYDKVADLFYIFRNAIREVYMIPPSVKIVRSESSVNMVELDKMYNL